MEILISLLIITLVYAIWRDKGHLSYGKIFLALFLVFHLLPLTFLHLYYDAMNVDFSLEQVTEAVSKATNICFFISLGYLLARYVLKSNSRRPCVLRTRLPINFWIRINIVAGSIIILNNIPIAYQALTSGYLNIYASPGTLLPIKAVTVLPVYAFTFFYSVVGRIDTGIVSSKRSAYIIFIIFFLVILSFIFTGSRSTVVYLGLSLLALWSSRYKIKIWRYLPHAVGVVLVSVLIGLLREGSLLDMNPSELFLRPIVELLTTSGILLNYELISDILDTSGGRYIRGLLLLFPMRLLSFLDIDLPPLLSQQYVNIIDPGWAEAGGGFGFSLVVELYLLGGLWGAWIFALLTGIAVGWIDLNIRSPDISKSALSTSIGLFMFFAIRGEILELYRPIAVVLFLHIVSIMCCHIYYARQISIAKSP